MGLITKEIKLKWNSYNKNIYTNKGYTFTGNGEEFSVKVEDVSKRNECKIDVTCDNCDKYSNVSLRSYYNSLREDKHFCYDCSMKLFSSKKANATKLHKSISFEDWCYKYLPLDVAKNILLRWDYDKNKCSPKDVSYGSNGNGGFWFKCLICSDHESELKSIKSISHKNNRFIHEGMKPFECQQCLSIFYKNPELIKFFVNIEDTKKYSAHSNKKAFMKCPYCNFEKYMTINAMAQQGFACPQCGISNFPNKFMCALLSQIGMDFKREKRFDWCNFLFKGKKRIGVYDFYFKTDKEYIIEMDGGFHSNDNNRSGQTKEESKFIDDTKDELAKKHNIEVIRINCETPDFIHIHENIFKSRLIEIFELSNIDWKKCCDYANKSSLVESCELWNNGHTIEQISKIINCHKETVRRYLKNGFAIGICTYDYVFENHKSRSKNHISNTIKVICLTTNETFDSIREAASKYDVCRSNITLNAQGKIKYAGRHPITNEFLRWVYYDQYLNEEKIN